MCHSVALNTTMSIFKKQPPYERRPVKKLTKETILEMGGTVELKLNDYLNWGQYDSQAERLIIYLLLDVIERLEKLEKAYNAADGTNNAENESSNK